MNQDEELRSQLVNLLALRQAHMDFEDAVEAFPMAHINACPPGCEYTFWYLLEHMRICQRDILDYIESEDYRWPNFPGDLWPDQNARTDPQGWQRTIAAFYANRARLVEIIQDANTDLFAPLPNSGEKRHNILREVHIVASHNATPVSWASCARSWACGSMIFKLEQGGNHIFPSSKLCPDQRRGCFLPGIQAAPGKL